VLTGHRLHVVVAVISRRDGHVLIALRPRHVHQGGLWEFPGGKVSSGESAPQALARELREELGIQLETARPLIRIQHDYLDQLVLLDVWRVVTYSGTPTGKEGQKINWVSHAQLSELTFPEANRSIIKAIHLPSCYMITPEPEDHDHFLEMLRRVIKNGTRLIQFRANNLNEGAYSELANRVIRLCQATQTRLLLNCRVELALELGADGVHLNSRRLISARNIARPPHFLLAASCHNRDEVLHASYLDADFIVVSPVLATLSHPQACPLGWERFYELSEVATIPVYALGGMSLQHLDQAYANGAQGIAGISAF